MSAPTRDFRPARRHMYRVRESESQRVRESESQRVRESESQRVKESESQRVRESESQRFRDSEIQPECQNLGIPQFPAQKLKNLRVAESQKSVRFSGSDILRFGQNFRISESQNLRPGEQKKKHLPFPDPLPWEYCGLRSPWVEHLAKILSLRNNCPVDIGVTLTHQELSLPMLGRKRPLMDKIYKLIICSHFYEDNWMMQIGSFK